MEEKPICPLLLMGINANAHRGSWDSKHYHECLEERCAWWDASEDACCIRSLGIDLNHIANMVAGIGDVRD